MQSGDFYTMTAFSCTFNFGRNLGENFEILEAQNLTDVKITGFTTYMCVNMFVYHCFVLCTIVITIFMPNQITYIFKRLQC